MWPRNKNSAPKRHKESTGSLKARLRRAIAQGNVNSIDFFLRQLIKRGVYECPEVRDALTFLRGRKKVNQ